MKQADAVDDMDDAERQRINFHLRQFVDAMSPPLMLMSNPATNRILSPALMPVSKPGRATGYAISIAPMNPFMSSWLIVSHCAFGSMAVTTPTPWTDFDSGVSGAAKTTPPLVSRADSTIRTARAYISGLLKRVGLLRLYECGCISPSALTSSSTAAPMNSSMTMLRDKARRTGAGSERVSRVTRR